MGKDYVGIRYEMIDEARASSRSTGGRTSVTSCCSISETHAAGMMATRWFVEATNFASRSAYRGASEHLKMTERFTPMSPGVVDWKVTFDDPHTWTRPWSFAMMLTRKDRGERVDEYACHEGNYGLQNILSGARAEDGPG
jgi:hypothetical protein